MAVQPFEKLATFYLGKSYDVGKGEILDELLLYDAKDLTTHAVCVGMTGSGKTGLCLSLLEEAAIDGVPAIAIDPKGDLGNLLLTFPSLAPEDFLPWIEPEQAARKGMTVAEYAKETAATWKKGLASWGEDGERIRRFRESADLAIYTPGSTAGLPLKVLKSFAAPPPQLLQDADALRERVLASVSGILTLLGIDADPVRSREHIFLSNLLDRAWRDGRDLALADLIREIQQPPFDRVGVMDLDAFYPSKDRFALAMTLNNLLASPGFQVWMEGEPLDAQRLLYTPEGKPRLSIVSIAHLSDAERMFFVTMLLNEVVSWMRTQSGSSSLRALLYMDEVFGFLPPTANPPSKTPMLTLLKQARAFGLGVVLATQNPVDLDYKALSNAGTWFLGRLQTERDKARVLEGLEGVSANVGQTFDRQRVEAILAGLKGRVFYMNNVHDDRPTIFHTRWALSYLRGPLTRAQIQTLMADRKAAAPAPLAAPEKIKKRDKPKGERPILPPEVPEAFVLREGARNRASRLVYRPALLAEARTHYARATYDVDHWTETVFFAPLEGKTVPADPWGDAKTLEEGLPETEDEPEEGAGFVSPPAEVAKAKSYKTWEKRLVSHVYRERPLTLWRYKPLKAVSETGENEGDFRARLVQLDREKRDLQLEKLRKKYAPKVARLEERIRKAAQRVEVERDQYQSAKTGAVVSLGTTILGALFGRKTLSTGTAGRVGTTVRGAGRAHAQKQDIERAKQNLAALQRDLEELNAEFEEHVDTIEERTEPEAFDLEEILVRPRKSDTSVSTLTLAWTPWQLDESGIAEPLFEA